jgi:hypothetical protein
MSQLLVVGEYRVSGVSAHPVKPPRLIPSSPAVREGHCSANLDGEVGRRPRNCSHLRLPPDWGPSWLSALFGARRADGSAHPIILLANIDNSARTLTIQCSKRGACCNMLFRYYGSHKAILVPLSTWQKATVLAANLSSFVQRKCSLLTSVIVTGFGAGFVLVGQQSVFVYF